MYKTKPGGDSYMDGVDGSDMCGNRFAMTDEMPRYSRALAASWTTSSIAPATSSG
jgi:hypothetical protein